MTPAWIRRVFGVFRHKGFGQLLQRAVSGTRLLALLSVVVGLAAGFAAYLYVNLVRLVHAWTGISESATAPFLRETIFILSPAMGGLLAGWLAHRFLSGPRATATASIIYTLRRQNATISPVETTVRALASAFTIGSGGSAGPEGPAVGIGAGIGSVVGRAARLPLEYLRTLVAAGAAAGIAAVFNAPIAAVMYALEVLVREFESQAFAMVVLATVTASVTSYLLLGRRIFLTVPAYSLNHPGELFFYLILGILAAVTAKTFTRLFLWVEGSFSRLKGWPPPLVSLLGGLLVGVLGLGLPQIMGDGHATVSALTGADAVTFPMWILLALLIGKMVATTATLGSGGSGGLFVPTLCLGAILGTLMGHAVHWLFVQAAPSGAYALVGMAAVFAGFSHAPFTSVMLLFEITNDYHIILPLLFTVGVTTMVSRWIDPESLDGHELKRRGLRLHESIELAALEKFTVREVMASPVETMQESLPLAAITQFIARHRHTGYPVVNAADELVGLISYADLHDAFAAEGLPTEGTVAHDLMRTSFATAYPSESLTDALRRMHTQNSDRVLVVDPDRPKKLIGIITKGDILGIYRKALGRSS